MYNAVMTSTYTVYSKVRAKRVKSNRWDKTNWIEEKQAYDRVLAHLNNTGDMTEDNIFYMTSWERVLNHYGFADEQA